MKLLKLELEWDEGFISDIRIRGDFFMHPEESVYDLERALTGSSISSVLQNVRDFFEQQDVVPFGIDAKAIADAVAIAQKS